MGSDPSRSPDARARHPVWPYLVLLVPPLCWAGNFVVGRWIHDQIPPFNLSLWRWVVALAVLVPFAAPALARQRELLLAHWKLIALLGLSGILMFHSLVYIALRSTGAINATLMLTTTPVWIVALSWLLFRDRVTRLQAAGIAVSLTGAVVVVTRADPAVLRDLDLDRGDLWMVAAVPNWALYSVLLKRVPPRMDPSALLVSTITVGVVVLIPLALWELGGDLRFALNLQTLASILYVGLFASVLAYVCWNRGVAAVGATRAGLFMHLVPVFSAGLAIALLGEVLRLSHVIGLALILAGIGLTTRPVTPPGATPA